MVLSSRAQLVDNYSLYSGSDGSDKDSATMYGPGGKSGDKLGVGLPVRRRHTELSAAPYRRSHNPSVSYFKAASLYGPS